MTFSFTIYFLGRFGAIGVGGIPLGYLIIRWSGVTQRSFIVDVDGQVNKNDFIKFHTAFMSIP